MESSRLAQSRHGDKSRMPSPKVPPHEVLRCTYMYWYFHVLTVSCSTLFLLFQLHAKPAFAAQEAVDLCSCVSSNLPGVSNKYRTLWFILFLYRNSMKEKEAVYKALLNDCKCTFQPLIEDQTARWSLTRSRLFQAASLPWIDVNEFQRFPGL